MANDRVERDYEDLVRLYLTDIGQYTLLTKDDEVRLAKAIEVGKEAHIGQYALLTKDDEVRLAKAIEAGKEAIEAVRRRRQGRHGGPQA